MQLRWYQQQAIDAAYKYLREKDGNPLIEIPTGGGKTPVIASIARDVVQWGGRCLILAHRKELLSQSADKIRMLDSSLDVGVYSASLGSKEKDSPITVGQIQSIYAKATEFDPFSIILVDEAHLVPPDGDGQYRTFLKEAKVVNPNVRLIGLTATPYRMKQGCLVGPDQLFNDICFSVSVRELINEGFLTQLISKEGGKCDTSELHIRGGEFIESEIEDLMMANVGPACSEIMRFTATQRRSVLIFCAGVKHAKKVAEILAGMTDKRVELITGQTISTLRDQICEEFKLGAVKYLVNVDVLTTGFDAPNVDCVAMLRPTLSPGLYYQIVGRGFRIAHGKENCLVLDFAGNVDRHGPVDQIKIRAGGERGGRSGGGLVKVCPKCSEQVPISVMTCTACGFQWDDTPVAPKHDPTASDQAILSGCAPVVTEHDVMSIAYKEHRKRGGDPDAPKTLRVDYQIGFTDWVSEWVCIEHEPGGFAHNKAAGWWMDRCSREMPDSAWEAAEMGEQGFIRPAKRVSVTKKPGSRFGEVKAIEFDPDWSEPAEGDGGLFKDSFNNGVSEDVPF